MELLNRVLDALVDHAVEQKTTLERIRGLDEWLWLGDGASSRTVAEVETAVAGQFARAERAGRIGGVVAGLYAGLVASLVLAAVVVVVVVVEVLT